MKGKILFTDSALPFILKALGYKTHSDDVFQKYIIEKGKKIYLKDILGFEKKQGVITKEKILNNKPK